MTGPADRDAPVIVVGGGISGAAAAGSLAGAGVPVWLLDQGFRLGGRMATTTLRDTGTRWDGRVVDWGASFLTARDEGFAAVVEDWVSRGLARPWTDTFHIAGPEGLRGTTTGPVRYATPAGLRSLVEDLVAALPTDLVTVVQPHDAVKVRQRAGQLEVDGDPASAVVLAMPEPQARRLLTDEDIAALGLPPVVPLWEPTIALVALFDERSWSEALDAAFVHDSPVLGWLADDGRRRGDDAPVLVAHADPVMVATHLGDPESAAPMMLAELREILGITATPVLTWVKRWRFARPASSRPEPFGWNPTLGIGLAGDGWFGSPRIETAWRSGHELGAFIARELSSEA